MKQLFTPAEYRALHAYAFRDGYPGYKPEMREVPNGDGKVDALKRYAHIATKYGLDEAGGYFEPTEILRVACADLFDRAFNRACDVALTLGVPRKFWPHRDACALRVLEYDPGVGGNKHRDADLLTVNCFRSDNGQHMRVTAGSKSVLEALGVPDDVHLGRLYEAIYDQEVDSLATDHQILASPVTQYSAVFFAECDPSSVLPSGQTCGDWVNAAMAGMRVQA